MKDLEPINTLPVQQFLNLVKSSDLSRAKEVKMSLEQAKILSSTLASIMTRLNGDYEKLILDILKNKSQDSIEIKVDGGSGWK
jgi:hypothetical protein